MLGAQSVIDLLQNDAPITIVDVYLGGVCLEPGCYERAACPITVIPRSSESGSPQSRSRTRNSFFGAHADWIVPSGVIVALILGTIISHWQQGKPIFSLDS